jgi:UDP-N-acetylmuramate dehydrogenase
MVAEAVMRIRRRKLPDPDRHPNAGSFFKNPVVSAALADALRREVPELKCYPFADGFKLAAAQLIDLAGWKRRATGAVEVWPDQPLVLVNRGRVDGEKLLEFAGEIQRDIERRFGVRLEIEPDTVGFGSDV